MIRDEKLDFWLKNNLNVILEGKHGTGKTTMVIDTFKRAGVKWLYFSASTMDPWVDFIGVPKEQKDDKGNSYLDLVRPKAFQNDEVEALFFDEFNRSPKKVRNAVLELIQFKSINGKKFNNLKVVWAAINPDNEDDELKYDVEKLDPAQLDRFHVKVDVPYKPSYDYFKGKYGDAIAGASVQWWHELDIKIKQDISPRRLDYAIEIYTKEGDLRDVLPEKCNVSKLIHELSNGSISKNLKKIFESKDRDKAKEFISNENNFHGSISAMEKNEEMMKFFLPLMPSEKMGYVISKSKKMLDLILSQAKVFKEPLEQIATANINKYLAKKINKALNAIKTTENIKVGSFKDQVPIFYNKRVTNIGAFRSLISRVDFMPTSNTVERLTVLGKIVQTIYGEIHVEDAEKTIGFLNKLLLHTRKSRIYNVEYQKVLPIINFCFKRIKHLNPNFIVDAKKYSSIFKAYSDNNKFIFHAEEGENNNPSETANSLADPLQIISTPKAKEIQKEWGI